MKILETSESFSSEYAGNVLGLQVEGNTRQTQLSGKNLWNNEELRITTGVGAKQYDVDGYVSAINTTGDGRAYSYANADIQIPLKAGVYTLIWDTVETTTVSSNDIRIYTEDGTALRQMGSTAFRTIGKKLTFFTLANDTSIGIVIKMYTAKARFMFVSGSLTVDEPYEQYCGGIPSPNPDYPQEIHSVEEINVEITGKNLCHTFKGDLLTNTSGEVTKFSCQTLILDVSNKSEVSITGDYTLLGDSTMRIGLFDEYPKIGSIGVRKTISASSTNKTVTTDRHKYMLLSFLQNGSSTTSSTQFGDYFQVEFGKPTDFEPYKSQKIKMVPPRPLNKLGDVKDELTPDGWVYRNKSVDLGIINWTRYTPNSGVSYLFYGDIEGGKNVETGKIMCNRYNPISDVWMFAQVFANSPNYSIARNNHAIYYRLLIKHDEITDATSFKTAVANTQFVYELATPETIPFTDESLIKSLTIFKGFNNISVTDQDGNPIEYTLTYMTADNRIDNSVIIPTEIDWTKSMSQSYEYWKVDPITWKDTEQITTVSGNSTINRDLSAETLGSVSIETTESYGEYYLRIYLKIIQNGKSHRVPLGTFLLQTPSSSFNGKTHKYSIDGYTPLIELKEKDIPLGYYCRKDDDMVKSCYDICKDNMRGPVIKNSTTKNFITDYVADSNDTWLSFVTDIASNFNCTLALDAMGNLYFTPIQKIEALSPVWEFNDDNSSILYEDVTIDRDLYGIPNVLEVIYSDGDVYHYVKLENNDEDSPVSIPNRGRKITKVITNPEKIGVPSYDEIRNYAERYMEEISTVEYTISYEHGYCPVTVGDCVMMNYKRAGLENVKARVISQTINCGTSCKVSEKAVFSSKLWKK